MGKDFTDIISQIPPLVVFDVIFAKTGALNDILLKSWSNLTELSYLVPVALFDLNS